MFGRIALLLTLASGCAASNMTFSVDYPRSHPAVDQSKISVLGVFKDGRMNEVHWDDVGTALAPALGGTCELGFTERLKLEEPDVFSKADAETKENGVTDDLFKQFATRARGEALLAMTIVGHVHGGSSFRAETMEKTTGKSTSKGRSAKAAAEPGLDISLALYSVPAHETALTVHLHYTGASVDEALQMFADKVHSLLPGAKCAGWRWK